MFESTKVGFCVSHAKPSFTSRTRIIKEVVSTGAFLARGPSQRYQMAYMSGLGNRRTTAIIAVSKENPTTY